MEGKALYGKALRFMNSGREVHTLAKNLEISYLLDFYGDVLTEKQREVMEQYYNDDLSLAEIADNFGITRQGVRDSIKRGESTILELEEKIGFAARYKAMKKQLSRLENLAKDIKFRNSGVYGSNEEIARAADEMLDVLRTIGE